MATAVLRGSLMSMVVFVLFAAAVFCHAAAVGADAAASAQVSSWRPSGIGAGSDRGYTPAAHQLSEARLPSINRSGTRGPAHQLTESAVCFHTGGVYHGANATLSVHPLPLVTTNETSESSITISKSHWAGVNTIKAGWHVSPSSYGDGFPRLFTYWTTRNDYSDGCYNLLCPGFIRNESSPVQPGYVLNPVFSPITLAIKQDGESGDWWLYYNDHEHTDLAVGRWPKKLFTSLDESGADSVVFGGEVFFDEDDNRAPPMGSGNLGRETEKAASFSEMQQVDKYGNHSFFSMDSVKFYADNPACYDTKMVQVPPGDQLVFFYGGPQCQNP